MATEYEWKFKATPEVLAEIYNAFTGTAMEIAMETTYYDTPSGALSARHYTLRRRLENGVSVCTLKAPAGSARGEWETECESIHAAIVKLLALGCPEELSLFAAEGLVPICSAKFTRLAKTVSFPGGMVEIALDQGCLMGGNRKSPLCEVEVELKSGPTEQCDSFAKALAAQFSLEVEEKSKFRRALALYKGE